MRARFKRNLLPPLLNNAMGVPGIIVTSTVSALALFSVSGCATYTDDTREMRLRWSAGEYAAAASDAQNCAESCGGADSLIWKLEAGSAMRAGGDLKKSEEYFDAAYAMLESFDSAAEIDLAGESKALFTNPSYLPYTGRAYDRIMLGVYQTLNCLQQGNFEDAAAMLKRVEFAQNDIRRRHSEEISRGMAAAKKLSNSEVDGKKAYNYNAAMADLKFRTELKNAYGYVPEESSRVAGDYLNPYTYWLDGIYFTYCGVDSSDFSRACDSFRFARSMVQASILDADMLNASRAMSGVKPDKLTYVIYEAGSAPTRSQIRLDIPMFIATREVPYVGAAFPKLVYNGDFSDSISVLSEGKAQSFELLADIDSIVKREFDDDLPLVIAKTLFSSAAKAAAQYGIQEAARAGGGDYAALAAMIVGSIYQASMNDADLRTWTTLPKRVKIARFPTPKNLSIKVEGVPVTLSEAPANIVWVRKTGRSAKPAIMAFPLGQAKNGAGAKKILDEKSNAYKNGKENK